MAAVGLREISIVSAAVHMRSLRLYSNGVDTSASLLTACSTAHAIEARIGRRGALQS
jgi:hypothetical protein